MKYIKLLLILTITVIFGLHCPSDAAVFAAQRAKIEQNKIQKNTVSEIKALISEQDKQANKHCLEGLQSVYSKDFVNSDGFNYDAYMKLVEDTWNSYPDITYKTQVENIEFANDYAEVFVTEIAYATPKEVIGDYETVGELYSVSKCIYFLQKHGTIWLIHSEKVLEETSTLKYGDARYIDITLNAPKQIGSDKYYTATLKVDVPKNKFVIASINKEKIVYPQSKPDDAFRKFSNDNILERVFVSNKDNVNEYVAASIGITQAEQGDTPDKIRVYMGGLAFIMSRVNVVPENKFIVTETK